MMHQGMNKRIDDIPAFQWDLIPNENHSIKTIIWVNQHADFVGGAERYIYDTVKTLKSHHIRNILLYEVKGQLSHEFSKIFDECYPLVDPKAQAPQLNADVSYIHCLSDESLVNELFILPGKKNQIHSRSQNPLST